MGTTNGLQRGLEVLDTGKPISVPVGNVVLGRMFDVLGNPIDDLPLQEEIIRHPIHCFISYIWRTKNFFRNFRNRY
ncbi:hypothetical protein ONA02_00255 [Mycoplasmopsis felis]|nr:hypothetical protein [Mycoplasmopsis felis]WAM02324.1 hypothetical protein ONA02_00255 [Mycoplasmopsis felis]